MLTRKELYVCVLELCVCPLTQVIALQVSLSDRKDKIMLTRKELYVCVLELCVCPLAKAIADAVLNLKTYSRYALQIERS